MSLRRARRALFPHIIVSRLCVTLSGSNTFSSIKRASGNGGVFEFSSIGPAQTISGATFSDCSSQNGGAIYALLNSTSYKLILSSLTFKTCSASECGGAVYIDGGSYISTSTLAFSSLTFTNCSATTSGSGIYISGTSLSSFTGYTSASWKSLVGSSYSSATEDVYVGGYSSASKTLFLHHVAFTPGEGSQSVLYVLSSSEGVESETCGWSDIPCHTIGTAYGHGYTSASSLTVTLTEGSHVAESGCTSITQTSTFTSASGATVTKSVTSMSSGSSGVFVVSTASITVTFESITFAIESLNCALFYQTDGELTLHSLYITSPSSQTIVNIDSNSCIY